MPNQNRLKAFFSIENVNIILISFLAIMEGMQWLIVIGLIFQNFPLTVDPQGTFFPEWLYLLKPERELLFFRIFVASTLGLQALGFYIFKKFLNDVSFSFGLLRYALLTGIVLLFELNDIYKIFSGVKQNALGFPFYAALSIAMGLRLFWFKIDHVLKKFLDSLNEERHTFFISKAADILMPIVILLIIYIPDTVGALATIFDTDWLAHLDAFVMSPGWAFLKGCVLYVDTGSAYGLGIPIFFATLAKMGGGFSYQNVLAVAIILAVIYFILMYLLLRYWLKDPLLAVAGTMWAIKLHLFHEGAADPFIWRFLSPSVLRYLFDIPFFLFLLLHIRKKDNKYVLVAAAVAGLSIFYMTDTGLYQLVAFYAYLFLSFFSSRPRFGPMKAPKELGWTMGILVLPWLVALLLFWAAVGPHLWTTSFWKNFFEFFNYFNNGFGALPIYTNLQEKKTFEFFLGLLIPVVYLWTVIYVGAFIFLRKILNENIFVVTLGIYGLSLYNYFICRSAPTNFYTVCVPFLLLLCFWYSKILSLVSSHVRQGLSWGVGLLTCMAFLSTDALSQYPNIFNRNAISASRKLHFIEKDFDFHEDGRLITALTTADQKVCLISSFETSILMEADRKPFLYFFPLINPRRRDMIDSGGAYLYTGDRLKKTIEQLEKERPEYVFVEKKLISGELPGPFYKKYVTLTILVTYLRSHYLPFQQGEYLIALKRKGV